MPGQSRGNLGLPRFFCRPIENPLFSSAESRVDTTLRKVGEAMCESDHCLECGKFLLVEGVEVCSGCHKEEEE